LHALLQDTAEGQTYWGSETLKDFISTGMALFHPLPGQPFTSAPVTIEDRVWIGARAMVLKGVTIGHDSIIGAGSIVTRDVPPLCVAVGQPARVIRRIEASET
jgi:acetyltransferase-like isoleucine patch superfamily enzyme